MTKDTLGGPRSNQQAHQQHPQAAANEPTNRDTNEMLKAALLYAERGWPVFPCDSASKQPRTTDGYKGARADADAITSWWSKSPDSMIGLPTGSTIGAFVIDLDPGLDPASGLTFDVAALRSSLERELGRELPKTWTCQTPRGGQHLYFASPDGEKIRNRAGMLPRIDVRGDGGYVIAPPSRRADGVAYQWLVGPDDIELAAAPTELCDLVLRRGRRAQQARPSSKPRQASRSSKYGLAALQRELQSLSQSVDGTRNDNLFHAAIRLAQLVAAGHVEEAIARAGLEGAARNWPDLRKSMGTIESGFQRGLNEPRTMPAQHLGTVQSLPQSDANRAGETPSNDGDESDAELQHLHLRLAFFPMTDLGNAERLAERFRKKLIWCRELGWLWFDGRVWLSTGSDEKVMKAAHEIARAIQLEASSL